MARHNPHDQHGDHDWIRALEGLLDPHDHELTIAAEASVFSSAAATHGCVAAAPLLPLHFAAGLQGQSHIAPPESSPVDDPRFQERSEKKRHREKKRRNDANLQFAELSALLQKIEQEEDEELALESGGAKKRVYSSFSRSGNANRIEMVAIAVATLDRIHEENKKRKTEMKEMKDKLREAQNEATVALAKVAEIKQQDLALDGGKQDKILMMVPMMISPEAVSSSAVAGSGSTMTSNMIPNTVLQMQQFMSQWATQASGFPQFLPNAFNMSATPPTGTFIDGNQASSSAQQSQPTIADQLQLGIEEDRKPVAQANGQEEVPSTNNKKETPPDGNRDNSSFAHCA